MKICFIAPASNTHTVRWVNGMSARGHDIHLITMHKEQKHSINSEVTVHYLKTSAPFGYYINVRQARRIIKTLLPDVIHVHYASGYGTLGRLVDCGPVLLSVWGSDVYLFPDKSKRNENTLRKNLAAADRISSTSEAMKQRTMQFVEPKVPINVIPFGIDMEQFSNSASMNKKKDKIVIGTVKWMEDVYGIDLLIQTFAHLVHKLKEEKQDETAAMLHLQLVGDGSKLESYTNLAKSLGIAEMTEFTGRVRHETVPDYLHGMDIYCAFSRSESFGVAILEASACGKPVIASDVGGLPEVIRDGETGYLVSIRNMEQMTNRLRTLVLDEQKRMKMGEQGRLFVKELYDFKKNLTQMEEVYEEMNENNPK